MLPAWEDEAVNISSETGKLLDREKQGTDISREKHRNNQQKPCNTARTRQLVSLHNDADAKDFAEFAVAVHLNPYHCCVKSKFLH